MGVSFYLPIAVAFNWLHLLQKLFETECVLDKYKSIT